MKSPLIFIEHILDSIKLIEFFIKGISKKRFIKNKEKQSAIVRQLEIIGKASKNIPEDFRRKYSQVQWKDIIRARDKIIHHYFGIDLSTIWDIIKEDIPKLREQIKEILKKEGKNA